MCMLIAETRPVARKAHDCMAYEYLDNFGFISSPGEIGPLTYSELRALVRARLAGGKIRPGEPYVRQCMNWDGEIGTYRAIPEIHAICSKYGVFDDC